MDSRKAQMQYRDLSLDPVVSDGMGGVSKFQKGFVKALIPESGGMHGQIRLRVFATWRKRAAKIQEWEAVKRKGVAEARPLTLLSETDWEVFLQNFEKGL